MMMWLRYSWKGGKGIKRGIKAMAILMKQLANVTITDTDTLKSILNTLDAALKGSLSYSLTGEGKTVNRLQYSIISN